MKKYFTFVKIEHTLFSLPVIYAGMALGYLAKVQQDGVTPTTSTLWITGIWILVAATGARTVGFAMNRIVDRHIDAKNPRTAIRDLPSGRMTIGQAWGVLFAGLILYLSAALQLNPVCLFLSPIPLLVFSIYPFLKRFTVLAHFGVGLSLALGPLGGYLALRPVFDITIIPVALLTLFTWLWVSGFDIIYSTSDEEFDKREGLFSFPSRFGKKRALRYSGLLHLVAFALLAGLYFQVFYGSVIVAILLIA
ncbi:MAG: 4-hydroxybenzoate octaprenyltransferase, partial [Ignavibacteriota bacterium]